MSLLHLEQSCSSWHFWLSLTHEDELTQERHMAFLFTLWLAEHSPCEWGVSAPESFHIVSQRENWHYLELLDFVENEVEGNNQFFPAHVCLAKQIYGEPFIYLFFLRFALNYIILSSFTMRKNLSTKSIIATSVLQSSLQEEPLNSQCFSNAIFLITSDRRDGDPEIRHSGK